MDNHTHTENAAPAPRKNAGSFVTGLFGGFILGTVVAALAIVWIMPSMMIVTEPSKLDFDQTVNTIKTAMDAEGWASPGTIDLNQSLAKHGESLEPRVQVVQLCKAPYAADVLTTDRYVSCLMPCAISVWEADDGQVYVSKMNTGLMGKLFGGNIAKVMGTHVAREEQRILATVTNH